MSDNYHCSTCRDSDRRDVDGMLGYPQVVTLSQII